MVPAITGGRRLRASAAVGLAVLPLLGCGNAERPAPLAAPSTNAASVAQGPIDSVLPIEEHLRRFRQGLPEPAGLTDGGAPSAEALVRAMLAAVSSADTTALVRLLVSRSEFAYVYYPHHIYAAPPYELDPGTFWMLIQGNSAKGLKRVLRRFGGHRLEYLGHVCTPAKTVRPPLEEWQHCTVRFRAGGTFEARRLFGSMVSYEGRYKLVSYANEF